MIWRCGDAGGSGGGIEALEWMMAVVVSVVVVVVAVVVMRVVTLIVCGEMRRCRRTPPVFATPPIPSTPRQKRRLVGVRLQKPRRRPSLPVPRRRNGAIAIPAPLIHRPAPVALLLPMEVTVVVVVIGGGGVAAGDGKDVGDESGGDGRHRRRRRSQFRHRGSSVRVRRVGRQASMRSRVETRGHRH